MKVEVDADELCELRRGRYLTSDKIMFDATCSRLSTKILLLEKELDFWKEKCESACRWYDALLAEARAAHSHRVVPAEERFNVWLSEAASIGLNK